MIVSPSWMVIWRCSRRDMRDSAAIGSPWVPVVISTVLCGAIFAASSIGMIVPFGALSRFIFSAISMLRSMERPLNATLRLLATAALMAIWTRETFDANDAMTTRWRALDTRRVSVSSMPASEAEMPGMVALVESHMNRSMPSSPRRASAGMSVGLPSYGVWSTFTSPVITTWPAPVLMETPRHSGMEWLTCQKRRRNGPTVTSESLFTSLSFGRWRCSCVFALISALVNLDE